MGKLSAIWALFRQGEAVGNPAAWKAGQITGTVLGALILALVNVAAAFGHPFPVDTDTANSIGGGIIAAINVLLTITTSKHAGLPAVGTVQGVDCATESGVQ
jgi:hypothetical protein